MASIRLVQIDKTDSEFDIKVETKIGRGPVFDISDKKVSRNHAILTPIFNESKLELKSTHINPCFIQLKGEEKKLVLEKDSSMKLSNGDVFSLLANKHSFKIVSASSKSETTTTEKNGKIAFVKNLSRKQEPNSAEEKKPSDIPEDKKVPDDSSEEKSSETNTEPPKTETEGRTLPQWMQPAMESPTKSPKVEEIADKSPQNTDKPGGDSSCTPEGDLNIKDTPNKPSSSTSDKGEEKKPSNGSEADKKKKDESEIKQKKRTTCIYGRKCYRNNQKHFDEFAHPGDTDYDASSDDDNDDNPDKPVCPYGSKCYRKNPAHRKEYCHPSTSKTAASKKSTDEDESSSDGGQTRKRRPNRRSRKKQQRVTSHDDEESGSESDIVDSDDEDVYVANLESESMSEEEDWKPKSKRRKKTPPPPKVKEPKKKKKKGYTFSDSEVSGEDEMSIYDDDESDAGFSYDDSDD